MKNLLLETNLSKIYVIVMILISFLLLGGYFSYAMFTVSKEKKNAISIVTGNLVYKLEVDGKETNKLIVPKNTTKEFIITLSNPNIIKARFNFYYIGSLLDGVNAGYLKDSSNLSTPPSVGTTLDKKGTDKDSNNYKIIIVNNSSTDITINLGVHVGLDYNDLKLEENEHLFEPYFKLKLKQPLLGESRVNENGLGKTYNDVNFKDVELTSETSDDINNIKLMCTGVDNLNNPYNNVELIDNGNKKYTVKSNVDGQIVATITCTLTGTNGESKIFEETVKFKIGNGWYWEGIDPTVGSSNLPYYYYYKKGQMSTGWQYIYHYKNEIPSGRYDWYYFFDGTETSANNGCQDEKYRMARGWCKNIGGYSGWYYFYIYRVLDLPTSTPFGSMIRNATVRIYNYDNSLTPYTFDGSGRCISGNGCF